MKEFRLGHRVRHQLDGRNGFVISQPYNNLVPVSIEGSTRKELWALNNTKLRPINEQLVALGGKFKPPKGFPLHNK